MIIESWTKLVEWLGAELAAVIAIAAVAEFFFKAARVRRALWQGAVATLALLWLIELGSFRDLLPFHRPEPQPRRLVTVRVIAAQPSEERPFSAEPAKAEVTTNAVTWPGFLWLAGCIFFLTKAMIARARLDRRQFRAAPADEETLRLIASLKTSMRLSNVICQAWSDLRGPIAFGTFRRVIAVPSHFSTAFSETERQSMLAHEMAHLAARDPFWMLVAEAVIALSWWHPAVWWVKAKFRAACESAADEASGLVPDGGRALAKCLVRLGRELTDPAFSVGGASKSHLARRIKSLLQDSSSWRPLTFRWQTVPAAVATFIAAMAMALPVPTGLLPVVLTAFAPAVPARADVAPVVNDTVQSPRPASPTNAATEHFKTALLSVTGMSVRIPAWTNVEEKHIPTPSEQIRMIAESGKVADGGTGTRAQGQHLYIPSNSNDNREKTNSTTTNSRPGVSLHTVQVIEARNKSAPPSPKLLPGTVQMKLEFVEVTEKEAEALGLERFFPDAPKGNACAATSRNWNDLPKDPGRRKDKDDRERNVIIDIWRTGGTDAVGANGQSALLTEAQFSPLRARLLKKIDVLASPAAVCKSGMQAVVAMYSESMLVTGVATNGSKVNYLTDSFHDGISASLKPQLQADGSWRIDASASLTKFLGYDEPPKKMKAGSIDYVIPLPHCSVVQASAVTNVPVGQTMAVRGPLQIETVTKKGGFFSRTKTTTTRRRLYVFVTPTEPPA